jgi:Dolichyl-phosphate-mannose-protein mannosyltransferase
MEALVDKTASANAEPILGKRTASEAQHRSTALLIGVLLLATIVITRGIGKGEFNYNVDETQHAVTGLYVADFLRDLPVSHPVQYTYRYYAQYPALAGIIHWPPLFYVFEGMVFRTFGPSVIAARSAILLCALFGLYFWFRLVKELQNEWTAALSTALLALLPAILLFEKTVMLEIPSLSLCIAASYFWIKYLRHEKAADVYWFAGLASAALLTKQNSIYLGLFCLFTLLVMRQWRLAVKRDALRALALCLLLVGPFYVLVYVVHWSTIAMDLGDQRVSGAGRIVFYWKTLPEQLGWTLFLLSILGAVTSRLWDRCKTAPLMLSWIFACYLTFTLIGLKESRYIVYWLPPFLYFAASLLTSLVRTRWQRVAMGSASVVLVATGLVSAWSYQRPYVTGYAPVAKRITEESKSGVVLFDGDLAGNFIFFMRAYDPSRRFIVLRKALYAYRIKQRGGAVELVHSREELNDLVRRYGIRFIVISDNSPTQFEAQRLLREFVRSDQFLQLGRFPVQDSDFPRRNAGLLLYENVRWAPPTERFLRIKMLTLNHDIVVPLDEFRFGAQ